jgi:hypothetical protein
MDIFVKCSRCGNELEAVINTAEDGIIGVYCQPCSTCNTREFHEGRDFERSMQEAERRRIG